MKRSAIIASCLAIACFLVGCGPEVNILEPQEGDVFTESTVTALMEFTSAARTFEVALDGNDVSSQFFITNEEAGGTLTGLSTGSHIMQVSYTSTSGFSDTDSVVFTVVVDLSLTSITATPATLDLEVGETTTLTVTGTLSDGSTTDLTTDVDTLYVSEDGTIVSVGTGGVVAGVGAGSAVIGVQNGELTSLITVTVTEAEG